MSDIYDQHKAAFANVSAYVITDAKGDRVATIAFKYPRDGAGRLYAYVHVFGCAMVRGFAAGGGYDKHSAAVASAARKIPNDPGKSGHWTAEESASFRTLLQTLRLDDSNTWHNSLLAARFNVLQAV